MFDEFGRMLSSALKFVTSGGKATRIDTRTDPVLVGYPESDPVKLHLEIGFGKLDISAGGEELVDGTVTYNVAEWAPEVKTEGGKVSIIQGNAWAVWPTDLHNEWALKLGTTRPYALEIHKGAAQTILALGGLPLAEALIQLGAGETTLTFDSPNPQGAKQVSFKSGAGKLVASGLLNANATKIMLEIGAGEALFSFDGNALNQDTFVKANIGAGQFTLNVKKGIPTRVSVGKGLGSITTDGDFRAILRSDRYLCETPGYEESNAPKLTVEVTTAVGGVKLNTL